MSIFATITTAFLLWPKNRFEFRKLLKHQPRLFWKLYFANAIQAGLGALLSIIGIALTEAINAGFLVKLATVTTILFAWILLNESMSRLKIAVVITMLSGAYLLTTRGQTLLPRVGDLFILGACVCWSFGTVLARKYLRIQAVNPDVLTLQKPIASLPIFLFLLGISSFAPEVIGNLSTILTCCAIKLVHVPYVLGSGVCLALAWIFLYRTMRVATASYLTLMSMVTPIIVSVLAMLILDEKLIWIQGVGAGMIILSGVITYRSDIASS